MTVFILTFFTIYSLMHLYVFLKAKAALALGMRPGIILAAWMALMVCAPFIIRLSERAGQDVIAHIMSYVGYIWLGVLILFISAAAAIDLYRFLLWTVSLVSRTALPALVPTPRFMFFVPLAFAVVCAGYGFVEALSWRTEHVTIRTSKIPKEAGRLRIVQITDVHLGLIIQRYRLGRILDIVKREAPDILVSTGDLVDGQINSMTGLAEMLAGIQPRYGKFAVTGNHEFYAGLKQAVEFTERAGFTYLRNRGVTVDGLINIAGVDDPTERQFNRERSPSEKDILSGLPRDRFTLLLKHRPFVAPDSLGLFDLQVSGHTHKGQIFPFSIVTWFYYPVHAGCLTPVDGCYLYVSRGTGTWGPPIRFLSPPEITVYDIVHDGGTPNRIEQ